MTIEFEDYEDVDTALDKWLREAPGNRQCITGHNLGSGYYCRLVSRGEETVVTKSEFSANDATANALRRVLPVSGVREVG